MRLYVAAGQDRDKVQTIMEEAEGDPEKIREMMGRDQE